MHPALITAMVAASSTGRHFHIGPWIIVPILILAAIAGTIVYAVRDHHKRHARHPAR
jgi:hypothetical protein